MLHLSVDGLVYVYYLWLLITSFSVVFWSAMMSSSVWSTFMSAVVTLFFAMYWNVRPVLMYFMNPILASRWVDKLLKCNHVLRDWRVDMILCSPNFKDKTCIFEWISWWTKKRGYCGFFTDNDIESFCVCGAHWKLSWVMDGIVVNCDG